MIEHEKLPYYFKGKIEEVTDNRVKCNGRIYRVPFEAHKFKPYIGKVVAVDCMADFHGLEDIQITTSFDQGEHFEKK